MGKRKIVSRDGINLDSFRCKIAPATRWINCVLGPDFFSQKENNSTGVRGRMIGFGSQNVEVGDAAQSSCFLPGASIGGLRQSSPKRPFETFMQEPSQPGHLATEHRQLFLCSEGAEFSEFVRNSLCQADSAKWPSLQCTGRRRIEQR